MADDAKNNFSSHAEEYDDYENDFAGDVTQKKKSAFSMDILLAVSGICLAASAAFLPWYVFFNQEEFGVRKFTYAKDRITPDWKGRTVVNVSPQAIPKRDQKLQELLPDDITTATINPANELDLDNSISQPFPLKPSYRLVHVANDQVLIEDARGMYVAKLGSILPDNSTLSAIENRNTGWVIITSNGDVVTQ